MKIEDRGTTIPLSASERELNRLDDIKEVESMVRIATSRLNFLLQRRQELYKDRKNDKY